MSNKMSEDGLEEGPYVGQCSRCGDGIRIGANLN